MAKKSFQEICNEALSAGVSNELMLLYNIYTEQGGTETLQEIISIAMSNKIYPRDELMFKIYL